MEDCDTSWTHLVPGVEQERKSFDCMMSGCIPALCRVCASRKQSFAARKRALVKSWSFSERVLATLELSMVVQGEKI